MIDETSRMTDSLVATAFVLQNHYKMNADQIVGVLMSAVILYMKEVNAPKPAQIKLFRDVAELLEQGEKEHEVESYDNPPKKSKRQSKKPPENPKTAARSSRKTY